MSMDRLREVHARLRRGARCAFPAPSVSQHGSGWRVRVTIDKKKVCVARRGRCERKQRKTAAV